VPFAAHTDQANDANASRLHDSINTVVQYHRVRISSVIALDMRIVSIDITDGSFSQDNFKARLMRCWQKWTRN
jgi:hypothetical protein